VTRVATGFAVIQCCSL